MALLCIINGATTGAVVFKIEGDGSYVPPAGHSVAPNNTGEIGDYWNGTSYTPPGSPPPPASNSNAAYVVGSGDALLFFAQALERARLEPGGRLIHGHTASIAQGPGGLQPSVQVASVGSDAAFSAVRYSADALGPNLLLGKGRGTIGTATAVVSGDRLGKISFFGADGTDLDNEAAGITADAVAAFTATSTPADLVIWTTPTGATAAQARAVIKSSGEMIVGSTPLIVTPDAMLHVHNTGTGNSFQVDDSTDPDATPFIVDAFGRVIIGHTTALSGALGQSLSSIAGSGVPVGQQIFNFVASPTGPAIAGHKSRSATIGGHAAALAGDVAFYMQGSVSDGAAWGRVGQINLEAEATATAGSTPGKMRLLLTPAASTTPVEVLDVNATRIEFNNTQILAPRRTGWAAATGTATKTTYDTTTVTTAQLAERVKALIDDLIAHGLIGA